MIEIPFSEHYENVGSYHGEPCIVCGRDVLNPKTYLIVGEGGGTAFRPDEEYDAEDGGFMGLQVVGPRCLRQHPELKPYVTRGGLDSGKQRGVEWGA